MLTNLELHTYAFRCLRPRYTHCKVLGYVSVDDGIFRDYKKEWDQRIALECGSAQLRLSARTSIFQPATFLDAPRKL